MAQPQWITKTGSLGTISEGAYFNIPLRAEEEFGNEITYSHIAGSLPAGVQLTSSGLLNGVPFASIDLSGVPTEVSENVTSTFVVRASVTVGGVTDINDRTFSITVTGQDAPVFSTQERSLGLYPDGTFIRIPLEFFDPDPGDVVVVAKETGSLPLGVSMNSTGLISGLVRPLSVVTGEVPGTFDATGSAYDMLPFDSEDVEYNELGEVVYTYEVDASDVSQIYPFTVSLNDGKAVVLESFDIKIIDRTHVTADSEVVTADLDTITIDLMPSRPPVSVSWHVDGNDIGVFKRDNFFAHKFDIVDVDGETSFSQFVVTEGRQTDPVYTLDDIINSTDIVPDLDFDPMSAWYTGYLRELDSIERLYTVNLQSYKSSNWPLVDSAVDWIPGFTYQPNTIVVYQDAHYITLSQVTLDTFKLRDNWDLSDPSNVTEYFRQFDSGVSKVYDFTITTVGNYGSGIEWSSGTYSSVYDIYVLGHISNGSASLFSVSATSVSPEDVLSYRIVGGELPPGLELSPTGSIIGNVSFETFSLDGGTTTFDKQRITESGLPVTTTIDSGYDFNVEAINQDETANSIRTFRIYVDRVFNEPYEELRIVALPPSKDRQLINTILGDTDVFPYNSIFRPTDKNFGVAQHLEFVHSYGLSKESLETYATAMMTNHHRKPVVLGDIRTAEARNRYNEHVYDIVYIDIVDTALNRNGESPHWWVDTAFPVTLPNGSVIHDVYPNSLVNMRNRIMDDIEQISDVLPLWMVSRQPDGTYLGFKSAWPVAYVKPGEGEKVAYKLKQKYGHLLNTVDFIIDRYKLVRNFSIIENEALEDEFLVFPKLTILG